MTILLHGDDTTSSRNYYFDLKQKALQPITIDGSTITLTDLQQILSGNDLFGESKNIFIEELFSKHKIKDADDLILLINNSDQHITLWESKNLTSKQQSILKNVQIKEFKLPSTIFTLLDAIKPSNGKEIIELFHKTLSDKDPEFILVMLQRQIRILLALFDNSHESISEVSRLAPWQRGKLERQTKLFSQDMLLDLHNKLFQLELGMKTGGLASPIEDSIDFFLLTI